MQNNPLVSVVIPFYNTPPAFMREAIESVISQTYTNWELLLIDDGSDRMHSDIALEYAARFQNKIKYYHHNRHENRGVGASRQLGISNVCGEYVAFLDADDVWFPDKLEKQVSILNKNPEAGMLSTNTLYWYSWEGTPESKGQDYSPQLGNKINALIPPPRLLALHLAGKIRIPCPSSVLIRKRHLSEVSWFEESLPLNSYEDQIFYAKFCMIATVYVSSLVLDKYRQHSASICAVVNNSGNALNDRVRYLKWLEKYLVEHNFYDPRVWQALKREMWYCDSGSSPVLRNIVRRMKKWTLMLEEALLPSAIRRWIWLRGIRPF
jgi:glycosyltransferase involved in cell wall biosynthesis